MARIVTLKDENDEQLLPKTKAQAVVMQSNNSVEGEINTLKGQMAVRPTIEQISNPNLLINGDFRVNQRGQTSYTNNINATIYTVDRWRMSLGNTGLNGTVITPNSNGGVNVTCSNAYSGGATPFIQLIESPQSLIGKTLTFSVYVNSINSGSARFRISNYTTFGTGNLVVGLNKVTYTVPSGTTSLFCGIICNASTAFDIDIAYMKLEIGNIATPYSPRPYAEELAMCQRYYEKIDISNSANKYNIYKTARNTTQFYDGLIKFMKTKRTPPTVTLYSTYGTAGKLRNLTQSNAEQDFSTSYITIDSFVISNTNGDMAANDTLIGYYSADAEIY